MGNGPRLRIWNCRHCRFKRKDEGRNGESSGKHAQAGGDAEVRGRVDKPEGADEAPGRGRGQRHNGRRADQLRAGGANSRNGCREHNLVTCVGGITLRMPKLRTGSFFPEDVAEKLGISGLSKDQVGAMAQNLDADVAELLGRDLGGSRTPYLWLDAAYVKRRRDGRAASTAVVTAIGRGEGADAAEVGRARRAGLPRRPAVALEAAAHEQPAGAGQPRDKAPQPRGAGVPVREIARAPGRGRDVRARRAVVRVALLRMRQDPGALRQAPRGRGRARKARSRARRSRQEDDRREHGACGKGGGRRSMAG